MQSLNPIMLIASVGKRVIVCNILIGIKWRIRGDYVFQLFGSEFRAVGTWIKEEWSVDLPPPDKALPRMTISGLMLSHS
jgi:hypothetical protein